MIIITLFFKKYFITLNDSMSLIFYFTRLHNCFSNKFDPHLIKNFKYFSHKHVSIYLRLPYACNLKKKKKKKGEMETSSRIDSCCRLCIPPCCCVVVVFLRLFAHRPFKTEGSEQLKNLLSCRCEWGPGSSLARGPLFCSVTHQWDVKQGSGLTGGGIKAS